jgi:hypothetical protein
MMLRGIQVRHQLSSSSCSRQQAQWPPASVAAFEGESCVAFAPMIIATFGHRSR